MAMVQGLLILLISLPILPNKDKINTGEGQNNGLLGCLVLIICSKFPVKVIQFSNGRRQNHNLTLQLTNWHQMDSSREYYWQICKYWRVCRNLTNKRDICKSILVLERIWIGVWERWLHAKVWDQFIPFCLICWINRPKPRVPLILVIQHHLHKISNIETLFQGN